MAMGLHNLSVKKKRRAQRVGRGNGSGHGTFCGRGQKGQRARSGGRRGLAMKGFRRTLLRIPKMKGNKPTALPQQVVKLSLLEKHLAGGEVTPRVLLEKGLVFPVRGATVKILADVQAVKGKYQISGCAISESAQKLIEQAGGGVEAKK